MLLKKHTIATLLSSFVFLFVCSITSMSQEDSVSTEDAVKIFEKVDIEARFSGGDNGWRKFLERNLNPEVPVKKKAPVGTYTVWIQFVVDKKGIVSDITALTNHGYGMEEEVIRILKISPKWTPAIQNGQPVKAYRKQPVTFMITEEKKRNRDRSW